MIGCFLEDLFMLNFGMDWILIFFDLILMVEFGRFVNCWMKFKLLDFIKYKLFFIVKV